MLPENEEIIGGKSCLGFSRLWGLETPESLLEIQKKEKHKRHVMHFLKMKEISVSVSCRRNRFIAMKVQLDSVPLRVTVMLSKLFYGKVDGYKVP